MKNRMQGIIITFIALVALCLAGTHFGWFTSSSTVWLLMLLFVICVPIDFLLDWGLDKLGLSADTARFIKIALVAVAVVVLTMVF